MGSAVAKEKDAGNESGIGNKDQEGCDTHEALIIVKES